jgi:macrolide transport system ATP-binding/permease protein
LKIFEVMGQLNRDVRYGVRQLRMSPGFTATAVIALALGVGANTAAFTLLFGMFFKSLPVLDPAQLYRIGDTDHCCAFEGFGFEDTDGDFDMFSSDLYLHLKKSAPEFEQLAAVGADQPTFSIKQRNAAAQAACGEYVSGNFFATLGVAPHLGRVFSDDDDVDTSVPVVVLSYNAWKSLFAGDPSVVGSKVLIQTHPFTVIGVAARGFFGERVTDNAPAFWIPLATEPLIAGSGSNLRQADVHWLYAIGRLHKGTHVDLLQARLSSTLQQWLAALPKHANAEDKARIPMQHVVIIPARSGIRWIAAAYSTGLRTLMLLSTIVLLIACANIANLLLARGTARRAEVSIRVALGAPRGRIIRQMLAESLLLSCIGGLLGLALAYLSSWMILALAFPDSKDLPIHASPSLTVLGFAFLVSLLSAILFGTVPARLSLRIQPAEVLWGLNRTTRSFSSMPQWILVVFQAALSLVLLVGATLTARSLYNLGHQNLVMATANRYVLHLNVNGAGYTPGRRPALYSQIQSRFGALGGVTGVGLAGYSFLERWKSLDCIVQEGQTPPHDLDKCDTTTDMVSPRYLEIIGVPMAQGREFTEQDTAISTPVAIVNETFAKRYYPGQDPIGKRFRYAIGNDTSTNYEIVGVFKDFKTFSPEFPVKPVNLHPLTQRIGGGDGASSINSIVIHFKSEPEDADSLLRHALAQVDANLTVIDLRSMDSQIAGTLSQQRLIARLAIGFGILALILASVGLYGVTSYVVVQRTGEIGVRMALGATRLGVILLVLRRVIRQIGLGLALGVPCALLTGYFMRSQLYEVRWYDPVGLIGASALLIICALAAGFIPARRAASIEPMKALRAE